MRQVREERRSSSLAIDLLTLYYTLLIHACPIISFYSGLDRTLTITHVQFNFVPLSAEYLSVCSLFGLVNISP